VKTYSKRRESIIGAGIIIKEYGIDNSLTGDFHVWKPMTNQFLSIYKTTVQKLFWKTTCFQNSFGLRVNIAWFQKVTNNLLSKKKYDI